VSESEQGLEQTIKIAVRDAIKTELGAYKVDKEQHYKDHLFLADLRQWYDDIRSSFWKSVVMLFVGGIAALLILGFVAWASIKLAVGK